MSLAQEDVELIQRIVEQAINNTPELKNGNVRYELDLRERTIRVEEELKHQRELMLTGFAQMDKRLEQMREESNKRFEQVDKRFEQMSSDMNKRFEQVDKRFEQVDKQLEKQSQAIMDIHQEIKQQMRWSFGILIGVGGLVIGILKLTA